MVKNFLFVLKRFKTAAVLNIIGLSVAFAVFIITMIQCQYDFSYNRNFQNSRNIYEFSWYWETFEMQSASISIPVAQKLQQEYPEIQACCVLHGNEEESFRLQDNEVTRFSFRLMNTNEDFLKVFTPEILTGNALSAFTERNKAMLTDDVAKRLFGNENPIGKVILQDTVSYTVVAVCKRFPDNCTLKNGIYTTILGERDYSEMGWFNYAGYFLLDSKDVKPLEEKLEQKEYGGCPKLTKVQMIPFIDLYFSHIEWDVDGGNLNTTLSFLAIGIIALLIAFINLMNFSVAMIPSRVRGMNIKKIVGANQRNLRFLTASEAPCFALASFLIGLFLVALFQTFSLSTFFSANLTITQNWKILAVILLAGMAIAVLFGLYPAQKVTSYQPAMALSGSFAQSKQSATFRNILITFQFIAAITLICVALFNKIQYDYMTHYSWGFNKDNVVYLTVTSESLIKTFEDEIRQNPDILGSTVSMDLPGSIGTQQGFIVDDKDVFLYIWGVRNDFPDFFGLKIIEGRNFTSDDNGKESVICNEYFVKKFDIKDIVGKTNRNNRFKFIGVINDINFNSLHDKIAPMGFVTRDLFKYGDQNYLFIRLSQENTLQTIDFLKDKWEKLTREPFDLKFLDDTLNSLYQSENTLARLISIFGIIAVIIAIMGVYGLIVFNAKYKSKEIAIRKVNGSMVREIMVMLNHNVLIQLLIAFIIAVPLAYFIVHKWLENFAYKTPVYWWVFLLGGLIVLLITLLTVSVQSYRAATQNPTTALNSI